MEQIKRIDIPVRRSSKNGNYVYLVMNILLLFILPLLSIASECIIGEGIHGLDINRKVVYFLGHRYTSLYSRNKTIIKS